MTSIQSKGNTELNVSGNAINNFIDNFLHFVKRLDCHQPETEMLVGEVFDLVCSIKPIDPFIIEHVEAQGIEIIIRFNEFRNLHGYQVPNKVSFVVIHSIIQSSRQDEDNAAIPVNVLINAPPPHTVHDATKLQWHGHRSPTTYHLQKHIAGVRVRKLRKVLRHTSHIASSFDHDPFTEEATPGRLKAAIRVSLTVGQQELIKSDGGGVSHCCDVAR
jgi:hypothetical protein